MKTITVLNLHCSGREWCFGKVATPLLVWFMLLFEPLVHGDPEWLANPLDNNWFNPANWSTGVVPGPSDVVHFGPSSVVDIQIPQGTGVFDIFFDVGAEAYTITALPGAAFGIGDDLVNNSAVEQNFVTLADDSSFGSFTFNQSGNDRATITGSVTFTQQPVNHSDGVPALVIFAMAGAGDATFHNLGASAAGGVGGRTDFLYTASSAERCTVVNEGATALGAGGGATAFSLGALSAAEATLIANGGTNGGGCGSFTFQDGSSGGTARVELFGNGFLDMSDHQPAGLRIGSLEGDGIVYLGSGTIIVGSSSLSTTFSGVLQPGTPSGGGGTGALEKIGNGTLTLSGANLYTAGTTVTAGTLVVSNTSGSGTVAVNSGILGGSRIISGAVIVGTGSGIGAFLAPAHGGNRQLTLTIQGSLTFNSDSTYTYTFKARGNRSKIDKVLANGVTINSGATINLSGTAQGQLSQGMVLTLIKNTAATPIAGTFAKLPDGGIVTINGNNLQASYSGGDGNDLTLTVVP